MISYEDFLKRYSADWTPEQWQVYHDVGQAFDRYFEREALAAAIKKAREAKNLSQRDLAELTGVQQKEICRIEKVQANPTFQTLQKLFLVLGITVSFNVIETNPAANAA